MAKHKKTVVNLDMPYAENAISLSGIIYFAVGLFLLIVVTFGLMWIMLGVMEKDAVTSKISKNPLALSKTDALPPEPRLQSAPGFGVESKKGIVNLELRAPQAEYLELEKQWKELLAKGEKDEATGTVISLPINEAKQRLLAQAGANTDKGTAESSKMMVGDSSAGRISNITIR